MLLPATASTTGATENSRFSVSEKTRARQGLASLTLDWNPGLARLREGDSRAFNP